MRVIAVQQCRRKGEIDILHHELFHGSEERADRRPPNSACHFVGDDLSLPLLVTRSGRHPAAIFKPGNSLVVSEQVRDRLLPFGVVFTPVQFVKLVNCWYSVGDFSYYDRPEVRADPDAHRSDEILNRLPDAPHLHHTIGRYYELLAANVYRMGRVYAPLRAVSLVFEERHDEVVEFEWSDRIIQDYPVAWARSVLFRGDVFDSIAEFFDWHFFTKVTLEL